MHQIATLSMTDTFKSIGQYSEKYSTHFNQDAVIDEYETCSA